MMRSHAERIAAETERGIASWGESGEIDLQDFFGELTLYTSSACLIGPKFREEVTPEYWTLFQDLEMGTDAIAYEIPGKICWCRLQRTVKIDGEVRPIYHTGVEFDDQLSGKAFDFFVPAALEAGTAASVPS